MPPLLGHARFALEALRPELQQYFIERNTDGRPYDRDTRTSIYERAKGIKDEQAFGTERDVTAPGYEWLIHSTAPLEPSERLLLHADLRLCLRDAQLQAAGVQRGQHLAGLDAVSLLHIDLVDALGLVIG